MKYTEEIPQRAFINAQIIQEGLTSGDLNVAIKSICSRYGLSQYQFMNQAYIVSLLYCLLVVPKEIWIHKNKIHPVFQKIDEIKLREVFHIEFCNDLEFEKYFTYKLLHKLRNSVAHANYHVDNVMGFTFWDECNGKKNFKCTISASNLMQFLSEFGSYLANLRKKT